MVYTLSLPDLYTCTIKVSPEDGNNLMSLSQSARLMRSKKQTEGIIPLIYPDVTSSVDFRSKLLSIKVKPVGHKNEITFADFLLNNQKTPWWNDIFASDKEHVELGEINVFHMNLLQYNLVQAVGGMVVCAYDFVSSMVIIEATTQDPQVSATIADSAGVHLQQYLTDYHVKKARENFIYYKKLLIQSKKKYDYARRQYSKFADTHQESMLQSVRSQMSYLEDEMRMAYDDYSKLLTSSIEAESKMQEVKPSFTTIQSATVPISPSAPDHLFFVLRNVVLSIVFISLYIFYKENDIREIIGLQ